MVSSASCGLSRSNPFITTQFVLVLYWIYFGSVESLKFTDPPVELVDTVTIEIKTTLNYSINCRTDDPNATTSLWHSSGELPVRDRISLDRQVYTIHGLKESDAGSYECQATSSQGGKPIRQSFLLVVLKEVIPCCPDVIPQKKVMSTGSNVNFLCHVTLLVNSGNTALKKYLVFKWYKKEDGTFVDVPDGETSRHNGSTSVLIIKNAKTTPKGGVLYKCEILYRGRKSGYFGGPRLVVHDLSAPNISELYAVGTAVVNEPNPVEVRCKADGYLVPQITWLMNGTQIPVCVKPEGVGNCDGQHYQALEFKSEDHAFMESWLTIEKTEYPRDHGRYTCVAKNSQTAQKDVEISIQTPPVLDKSSIYWPTNRKIHCMVTRSSPLPTFRWQSQDGLCLNFDPDCKPSDAKWQNITFNVSPAAGVATAKSTVTIAQDAKSGFYRCIATNVLGSDDHYLRFFATDVEKIAMTATSGKYDEGQTLKLRCVLLQKGSRISWYKDGQRLTHAADGRVNITWAVDSDGSTWTELVVEKLVTSDSGLYTCEAQGVTGKYSNDSDSIKVYEVYPPTILSFRHQTVYNETTVKLYCNITAHPAPTVKWLKDNKSLEDYIKDEDKEESCKAFSQTVMYRVRGRVGLLVICHPSHAHQTGFYTCQAGNQEGNSSATAFLDVLEDPVIVSPSKELTSQPVRVKLGNPWNATCKATGNPAPLVEWRREKGNEPVSPKLRDTNGAVLYMESVSQDDLGVYVCVAENSIKNSPRTTTARMEIVPDAPLPDPSANQGLSKETIIGISVVGGAVFIMCVLAITCFVFIRHQRRQLKEYHSQFFPQYLEYQLDPNRTLLEQCNNLPYDPDWEFPQERLILGDVIGSGAFGQVVKAEAIGITDFNPRDKSVEKIRRRSKMIRRLNSSKLYQDSKGIPYMKTTVAVKTLKANATTEEYRDLASELKILIHVGGHKNIVNLLGACTKGERLLVILEYIPHGSLLTFLRGKRDIYEPTWTRSTDNPEVEFTIAHLAVYAYQICRGMEFLASRKCIHRDLAARNILVGDNYVMKIADFGLARDIYTSDLYVKTTSGVLPVKWMALESLFLREYTEKSDVWSFGVCLWEMFTLGGTPYPGIPTEELLDFLSDDHRMGIPQNCPQEIYTIMTDCWQKERDHRPTFAQLSENIGKIMERKASEQGSCPYISFTEDDKAGKNGYYFAPVDSGSSMSGAAAGYSRQSSEDIKKNPLPPLPSGTEREREGEREERQQMLEPEASGSLSGNESGIELEEIGDETAVAVEQRPVAHSTGRPRKKSKSKKTFV